MAKAPLLLGAIIVYWGWQVQMLAIAVPMAIALEGWRIVRWRWDLQDSDFNRLSDLCAVVFIGVAIYQVDQFSVQAIFPTIELVPLVLFPLVFALGYATRERIKTSSLFWSVRRAAARGEITTVREVDLRYAYALLCLLAASSAGRNRVEFYGALAFFAAWGLWSYRPRHTRVGVWLLAMSCGLGLGFGAERGMLEARRAVEPWVVEWFQERLWSHRDPYRAQTAIGRIGRLKLSERILYRVKPARGHRAPELLRDGVYRNFSRNVWIVGNRSFEQVSPTQDGTTWPLYDYAGVHQRRATVVSHMSKGRALLAVPAGTFQLDGLNVEGLKVNALGSLRAADGPDLLTYTTHYQSDGEHSPPPSRQDLMVSADFRVLFEELGAELALEKAPPAEIVRRVEAHFAQDYRYSLIQTPRTFFESRNALKRFLRTTRAGHCEYFATATALALRAAGVPARYVTGYAVSEWSELEEAFLVRKRHGHAWVSAFVDGRWVDVDTTPSVWLSAESDDRPWWTSVYDFASWLGFLFDDWRYGESDNGVVTTGALGTALALVVVLVWRLIRSTKLVSVRRGRATQDTRPTVFLPVERALAPLGYVRARSETLLAFVDRLVAADVPGAPELQRAVALYYRYRFDPQQRARGSLSGEVAKQLEEWLTHYGPRLASYPLASQRRP
ncbi:MAG: transglutaminase domain-containing protein [Gammaproteobacteria bacterium]|nr:transglutaminase domain-containing protein [Gammaproteobacteria bacterium]